MKAADFQNTTGAKRTVIFLVTMATAISSHVKDRHIDCLPFAQKIRKFRNGMECKWKELFCLPKQKFSEKRAFLKGRPKFPGNWEIHGKLRVPFVSFY